MPNPKPLDEVATLRNIGPRTAAWLRTIGIETYQDLQQVGAEAAFQMLIDANLSPSKNALYALKGALKNVHWIEIRNEAIG